MIRILAPFALLVMLLSCNSNEGTGNSSSHNAPDSPGRTNPSAIDTTKHPDGMTSGSVISTDTAAMRVTPQNKP